RNRDGAGAGAWRSNPAVGGSGRGTAGISDKQTIGKRDRHAGIEEAKLQADGVLCGGGFYGARAGFLGSGISKGGCGCNTKLSGRRRSRGDSRSRDYGRRVRTAGTTAG